MKHNWTVAALAVCLLLPAPATAQDVQTRVRTRPRVRVDTRGGPFSVYTFGDKRGRIGVVVDTRANEAGDKIGARIEGITPGGPAEKAGLKAGDVITRFNTTALGGVESEEDDNSGPGMKLIALARRLEPGDTVAIEYRRGTDSRKATLIAEDLGDDTRVEMPDMSHMEGMFPKMDMPEGRTFTFAFGSPWGGIEMVSLNPDLGEYFGTREGVLVVRAPEDSSLTLKGGDVIVSIGGRKPSSPEQAMRILRSYDTGETVTLDVLRKKGHVNVTWKVPDEERRYRNLMPRMREEPSLFRVAPRLLKLRNMIRMSRAI